MIDSRGRLLMAAVGFAGCSMLSYDRALHALGTWLDSWPGIGHVAVGMHRQGYDLQLTQYDETVLHARGVEGRATFCPGDDRPLVMLQRCNHQLLGGGGLDATTLLRSPPSW